MCYLLHVGAYSLISAGLASCIYYSFNEHSACTMVFQLKHILAVGCTSLSSAGFLLVEMQTHMPNNAFMSTMHHYTKILYI